MTGTSECPFCCEGVAPGTAVCPHCSSDLEPPSPVDADSDKEEEAESTAFGPGSEIAGYEITRALSETSTCGATFLAKSSDGSPVVLKCAPLELVDDPIRREEWIEACRRAAALKHPHLVPILEVLEQEGLLLIIRPWVDGTPLSDHTGFAGPLPKDDLLHIGAGVLGAIDFLHSQAPPVLHGNIKPSNILLTESGEVLLMDTGISYAFDREIFQGRDLPPGVYECMSPEQIRGEPAVRSSDLYAMGVLLHRLATGNMPFPQLSEAGEECRLGHLNEPPPSIGPVRDDLPEDFQALVRALLAKAAEYRISDAAAAARELEHALDESGAAPIEAAPPPSFPPPLPAPAAPDEDDGPDPGDEKPEEEAFGASDADAPPIQIRVSPITQSPRAGHGRRNTVIALLVALLAGGYLALDFFSADQNDSRDRVSADKSENKKSIPKRKKRAATPTKPVPPAREDLGGPLPPGPTGPAEVSPPGAAGPSLPVSSSQGSTCSAGCKSYVQGEMKALETTAGSDLLAKCENLSEHIDAGLKTHCTCKKSPENSALTQTLKDLSSSRCEACQTSRSACTSSLGPLKDLGEPVTQNRCTSAKKDLAAAKAACGGICGDGDALDTAKGSVTHFCEAAATAQADKECAKCAAEVKKKIRHLETSVDSDLDRTCSGNVLGRVENEIGRCSKSCAKAQSGGGPRELRAAKGARSSLEGHCEKALRTRAERVAREEAAARARAEQRERERREKERAAAAINSL